jgi:hypothetical protein
MPHSRHAEARRSGVVLTGVPGVRSTGKYTGVHGGVGLVLLLMGGIVSATAWHLDWLGHPEAPRRIEQRTADSPGIPVDIVASVQAPASAVPPASPEREGWVGPGAPESPSSTAPVAEVAPRRQAAPRDAEGSAAPAVGPGPRFAVEFGPFVTVLEAEKTERHLNQAGHQTVRFRQQTGAALYTVLIERVPGRREAQALVSALREEGFLDAEVVVTGESVGVRVGEPMLLRAAVQVGETMRAKGHRIRVAAQPGEAETFVIRHGNFASREEAEARGMELTRLGLPNHVVRTK